MADPLSLLQDIFRQEEIERARASHLAFIQHCWARQDDPFIVGFHTKKICERIDSAFEDFKKGISTDLLIAVHHRSGKSEMVSVNLGPHWLGEFPDKEVMQVSYQANLAAKFSTRGRNIVRSNKYKQLYPKIQLSKETNKKNDWVIVDDNNQPTGGALYASGLYSGLTGNGYSLGILDDYFSGRKQAESLVQRESAWDAFTNDFITRAAPVYVRIVVATQWHWDDINGRIKKAMKEDPNFPKFEILSFPAKGKDYRGDGKYPGKYLFLERYPEGWYNSQYAALGKYASAALLDCDPQMRTGSILSTDGIVYEKQLPALEHLRWWRVWDLAHTKKQREGDDPDWTSGTLLAFKKHDGDDIPHLYIRDVKRVRLGAVERDKTIKQTAVRDGHYVKQYVENSIDSKDAYEYIKSAIPDFNFNEVNTMKHGDKVVRATPLEPIFEAPGHVHVLEADWNDDWLDEVLKFDGSDSGHDDQIDNMTAGYIIFNTGFVIPEDDKKALAARRRR